MWWKSIFKVPISLSLPRQNACGSKESLEPLSAVAPVGARIWSVDETTYLIDGIKHCCDQRPSSVCYQPFPPGSTELATTGEDFEGILTSDREEVLTTRKQLLPNKSLTHLERDFGNQPQFASNRDFSQVSDIFKLARLRFHRITGGQLSLEQLHLTSAIRVPTASCFGHSTADWMACGCERDSDNAFKKSIGQIGYLPVSSTGDARQYDAERALPGCASHALVTARSD